MGFFLSFIYSVIPALFLFFGNPNNVAKMAQYNQKLKMYRCTGAYIKEYRRTEMKEIKERNAGTGRKIRRDRRRILRSMNLWP